MSVKVSIQFNGLAWPCVVLSALLSGCNLTPNYGDTTPVSPSKTWQAEASQVEAMATPYLVTAPTPIPIPAISQKDAPLGLGELIDIALSNNPNTRLTWEITQATKAALSSVRGAYYPQVNLGELSTKTKSNSDTADVANRVTKSSLFSSIDYVLFDFGKRGALTDQARYELIASNYAHNAMITDVVLDVQRAYFGYLSSVALKKAQDVSLKEADQNLSSAQARHEAGLGTNSEVLQAKTALSRAQFNLQRTTGEIQALRGAVLTSLGLPPTSPIDIHEIPFVDLPLNQAASEVDILIAEAQRNNPLLASSKARIASANSHLKAVEASGYPVIQTSNRFGDTFRSGDWRDDYVMGVGVSFPLFTGFSYSYDVEQAKHAALAAEANYQSIEQRQDLAIWVDYYRFTTASQQIKTSDDLLESASQANEVMVGQYKEGVASILDLLSTQQSLENARATQVAARTEWLLALAQLRHDTGNLDIPLALSLE